MFKEMCMLVKCEKVCENLCRMAEGRQCIEDWYGRVLCEFLSTE